MIQVENISKRYRRRQVLSGVTFAASQGEMLVLTGPNGAGKSTLLNIMSGMSRPDGGALCYFGNPMKQRRAFAACCGYVPQADALMEELSVRDNLSLWTGRRIPDEALVEMFHLGEILPVPVKKLSGGMKRRVSVACAMANHPPLLLMDEPAAALDGEYRKALHGFMEEYRGKNGILVVATHEEEEIRMADRRLRLEHGCLI